MQTMIESKQSVQHGCSNACPYQGYVAGGKHNNTLVLWCVFSHARNTVLQNVVAVQEGLQYQHKYKDIDVLRDF